MAKTVLIIDDEQDLRDGVGTALRDGGFEVLEAKDGEEGLRIALEKHPDLILLDIVMPQLDGFGVLEKLQADEWGKEAKVIFLTALDDMESVSKAVEQGGHDYMVKTDWKLEDIVGKVREKLGV